MDFYNSISPYYDEIFPYDGKVKDFILQNLSTANPRISYTDIGCASGSLVLSLAPFFSKSTGIDLDSSLISLANTKIKQGTADMQSSIVFFCKNMLSLSKITPPENESLITCMGNTIPHLILKDEALSFFTQVKKTLTKNGVFIFQILNYDRIITRNIVQLPLIETENISFERMYSSVKQGAEFQFSAILTTKKTGEVLENTVSLYPYTMEELLLLIKQAGFANADFYGSFNGTLWTPDSFLTIGVVSL